MPQSICRVFLLRSSPLDVNSADYDAANGSALDSISGGQPDSESKSGPPTRVICHRQQESSAKRKRPPTLLQGPKKSRWRRAYQTRDASSARTRYRVMIELFGFPVACQPRPARCSSFESGLIADSTADPTTGYIADAASRVATAQAQAAGGVASLSSECRSRSVVRLGVPVRASR